MKLIFDSNVFDDLINGKLKLNIIKDKDFDVYITHIQVDEINECSNVEKRAQLFNFITEIRPRKIPTESFIIGTSRLGSSKIGSGNIFENLRKGNLKNTNDALIAETAIKNDWTLITNDKKLINKVIELGGIALTVDELLVKSELENSN